MDPNSVTTDRLTYAWPSNLEAYEPRIFLGLTAIEGMAGAMGFLLPVALVPSLLGFLLGLIVGALVILAVKRVERLDNQSPLAYLVAWLVEGRRRELVTMPLVSAEPPGTLRFAAPDGAVEMLLAGEGEAPTLPWAAGE